MRVAERSGAACQEPSASRSGEIAQLGRRKYQTAEYTSCRCELLNFVIADEIYGSPVRPLSRGQRSKGPVRHLWTRMVGQREDRTQPPRRLASTRL